MKRLLYGHADWSNNQKDFVVDKFQVSKLSEKLAFKLKWKSCYNVMLFDQTLKKIV